jgi:hypothetical protein
MKNITNYILIIALALTSFTSCKKYLDDAAINPNDPLEVTPNPLLANIELATFASYNGNLNRRSSVLTQHLAGIDGQYVGVANYKITEGDVTNEWKTIYAGALININLLIEKLGTKSPNYKGIAQTLYVMNVAMATDMWGDVPNKDALKCLSKEYNPHYDSQQSIYSDMQSMLSDAITNLKQPEASNLYFASTYDYIYGGDTKKWISAAYVLKARYANRLSKLNPSQTATDAIMYLDSAYANGLASSADDANSIFGSAANENNQWYAFENGRGYLRMGKFFVDMMNANTDPRLPYFAATDVSGITYTGADVDPANATFDESSLGAFYGSPTSKAPIVTYVEAKFIEAECKLRSGNTAGAASAFNAAVKESILNVTKASDPTYEAAHASETAGSIDLTKIMTEKYVALFTQAETYADWRRTGLPVLTPNPSGIVHGIPRILPTSQDERNYNPNAIIVSDILQKVWWDQ